MADAGRGGPRPRDFAPLAIGLGAVALGTALGWRGDVLAVIVAPPPLFRAAGVATALLVAVVFLRLAVLRIAAGREPDGGGPGVIVRGVRFVFLAVAAVAVAIGWLAASPLPFVLALVIAGIDVVETTFILIVLGAPRPRPPG